MPDDARQEAVDVEVSLNYGLPPSPDGQEANIRMIANALTRARQEGEAAGVTQGRREVWEEAERVHRKNLFCAAVHDDVCPDIREFRRRAAQEGS